jgi:hypothetical protein
MKSLPKIALIVGAMKSGTTNLFDLLSQHPEISPCSIKEPEFFCKDANFSNGVEYYNNLWNFNPSKHKVAIEASTCYTKAPIFGSSAQRISESGINPMIIYIMRHPLDRIKSQIQMSRIKGWKYLNEDGTLHSKLISYSKYYMQISAYYKYFSPRQILLLSFEELVNQPESTLYNVCEFLEIDTDFVFTPAMAKKHEGKIYLYHNTFIIRTLFGIKSYNDYVDYLKTHNSGLSFEFLIKYLRYKNKLSRKQELYIKSEIADDLIMLKKEFGFDTSVWNC